MDPELAAQIQAMIDAALAAAVLTPRVQQLEEALVELQGRVYDIETAIHAASTALDV